MYVAELDRPWLGTPFLFQGFEIRSQSEIDDLRHHCRWVYVEIPDSIADPDRRTPTAKPARPAAPAPTEAEQRFAHDVLKIVNQPRGQPVYPDKTTLEQEIGTVRTYYGIARNLVYRVLNDVREEKTFDAGIAHRVVGDLTESVLRNPDALTCFIQLKNKSEYTALHGLRVCILALIFGRHLGLDRDSLLALGMGGLLHDIGKIKLPIEILNKPMPLNEYEYSVMKTHVPRGVEILQRASGIPPAAIDVVRLHHERYNGGGYMNGLKGDDIGVVGMIGGIVDCYDALTSDRPYRNGISAHAALRQIYEWRGREFHPGLIEQFIQCMGIYPIGSVVELSTGEVGVVVSMNRVRRLKPRVVLALTASGTPYQQPVTVDLIHYKTAAGGAVEIERVLDPGTYGIDPTRYLPVTNVARAMKIDPLSDDA